MSDATDAERLALARLAAYLGMRDDWGPAAIADAAIRRIGDLRANEDRLYAKVRDLNEALDDVLGDDPDDDIDLDLDDDFDGCTFCGDHPCECDAEDE